LEESATALGTQTQFNSSLEMIPAIIRESFMTQKWMCYAKIDLIANRFSNLIHCSNAAGLLKGHATHGSVTAQLPQVF
jgi:hypothetical protein